MSIKNLPKKLINIKEKIYNLSKQTQSQTKALDRTLSQRLQNQ